MRLGPRRMKSYQKVRSQLVAIARVASDYQSLKATPGVLENYYSGLVRSLARERHDRLAASLYGDVSRIEALGKTALPHEREWLKGAHKRLKGLRAECDGMYITGWDYLSVGGIQGPRLSGLYRQFSGELTRNNFRKQAVTMPFPTVDPQDIPLAVDVLESYCTDAFAQWRTGSTLPNPVAFASDVFLYSEGARFFPDFNYATSVLLSARVLLEAQLPFPFITMDDKPEFLRLANAALHSGLPVIATGEPFRDGPLLSFLGYVVDRMEEPVRRMRDEVRKTPVFDVVLAKYKDTQTPRSVISFLKQGAGHAGGVVSVRDVSSEYNRAGTAVIRVTGAQQSRFQTVLEDRVTRLFKSDIRFKRPEDDV